ncbi:hypothetical protein IH981_02810 [Patescibacteria group bacterium]|nr:hypothetical protein [Patescibacteria group bacterium]
MDNDETENSSNAVGGVIGLVIILVLIGMIFKFGPFSKDYSKPWFEGNEFNLVCERPYSRNSECSRLLTSSNGEIITGIEFSNGTYLDDYDSECYEAASDYNFNQVCQVWDSNGNSWDVIPPHGDVEPEREL